MTLLVITCKYDSHFIFPTMKPAFNVKIQIFTVTFIKLYSRGKDFSGDLKEAKASAHLAVFIVTLIYRNTSLADSREHPLLRPMLCC